MQIEPHNDNQDVTSAALASVMAMVAPLGCLTDQPIETFATGLMSGAAWHLFAVGGYKPDEIADHIQHLADHWRELAKQ